MIEYRQLKRLQPSHMAQLLDLESACRQVDYTKGHVCRTTLFNFRKDIPAFYLAYSGTQLVGFLSLFLPGNEEAELNALVHPDFRRQGIFKELLSLATKQLNEIGLSTLLFVCEPQAEASAASMKALRAELTVSEYQMCYAGGARKAAQVTLTDTAQNPLNITSQHLVPASREDLPILASMETCLFDSDEETATYWVTTALEEDNLSVYKFLHPETAQPIGMANLCTEETNCTIFGLGILPEFRGKGYGKAMLEELMALVPANKKISLQVSSKNAVAFLLYQKTGFAVVAQQDYWKLP